jgi:hypothetical protein
MHSILGEFRRENIMGRGNSIIPFGQPCVSPELIRTDLIGEIVYRCASVGKATCSRLTYVDAPMSAMADRAYYVLHESAAVSYSWVAG